MKIVSNFSQSKNAHSLILVIVSGRLTWDRLVHPLKASWPISFYSRLYRNIGKTDEVLEGIFSNLRQGTGNSNRF